MDEGTFGVHQVELVVNAREDLSDGSGVGQHAHGSLDLGKIASGYDGGGLVVDTALESSGAPVDELDGSLGLDDSDGCVDIFGDNITTVHQATGHVFSVTGVALGHHVSELEHGVGNLGHGELLVVGLLSGDHRGIRAKHEVNTGVGHQVGLELSDIDVQGTIETKRGSNGGDNLGDQSVKVGVGGAVDIEGTFADIVDGLIVEHESHISVLKKRMGGEHGVVGLYDGSGHLRGGVDAEVKFAFLSIVYGETLEKEGAKTGSCSSTNRVEDEETLETGTLVSKLPHTVEAEVNNFLSDGVMATGVVVGGIFLSSNELFLHNKS